MSDSNENSAELNAALRDDSSIPKCCASRVRSPPSKRRRHNVCLGNGGMAHLVMFDHLVPFEMDLNKGGDEKRIRIFATFYHFGSKLYDCLHTIAIESEEESDASVLTALKLLNFEHFLSPEFRFPPVSDLLDIIETRQLDDSQMLFRISDLIDEHKDEKPEEFGPYDPSNPKIVPLDCAVDAITSVASMAYCFLATSFAEEMMKGACPEPYGYDDDDEESVDIEEEATVVEKKESVVNFRKLPSVEPVGLQQNAMLLLATRCGIEVFLQYSHEIGQLQFHGSKLSKVTPLMEAAASSSDSIVNRLLGMGVDPNIQSVPNCNTALIYAAALDGKECVREILLTNNEIKPDVYIINNSYHDAMMEAALVGGVQSLLEFLNLGWKPNFLEINSQMRESALTLGALKGHTEVVSAILDYHDKNPPQSDLEIQDLCLERYSALMEAAMEGNVEVCKLMLSRGTPTEFNSHLLVDAQSPLMLACSGGYPEIVDVLLSAGAKIEELNNAKNTPLMEACIGSGEQGNQIGVVKLLLSRHADVNAMNPDTGDTPLSLASRIGDIGIMKLLVEKGGDLTAGTTSPIVEAALEKRLECVQFILAHCKTIPQEQLSRALIAAAESGSLPICEELIRAGADLNFEQDERTAMMKAAKNDHFEIVQFMVNKGASINFKSSNNDATALLLACSEGHSDIAQFLIRNGADPMLKMDDSVNCFMEVARHGDYDLMHMLIEFSKGNFELDKEPPKLGITPRKTDENKKPKSDLSSLESEMLMMLNGLSSYPKKKGSKTPGMHDLPYSTHEIDMLTHMLKLQQQMVSYEARKNLDLDNEDIKKALTGLELAYGFTSEGKINFPPPPQRVDMDKLYNGELVPNIKLWAEQVANGWLEMERKVGKPMELSSFHLGYEGHSATAAAAVSAVAAAATGLESQAYLASVFAKMNNGEEMPRVPATVGSLNAASAAMTGISFHSDDAMRLFGGASFASKMLSENKKTCGHQQYASLHHIQEGAFRAALLKMSAAYKERKNTAISVRDMQSNFPIETKETRITPKHAPIVPKSTSMTVAKSQAPEFEVSAAHKASLDPTKVYPGIIMLAADMEAAYRANPTDASLDIAITTAYIASTLPDHFCAEMHLETGDRLLKKLLSGMSEKQKNVAMARMRSSVNTETGSDLLRRSINTLSNKPLKAEYLKLFQETADCAFYDKCLREKNQRIKAVEQKKKAANLGGQKSTASKPQMAKPASTSLQQQQQQQQQGQLRRTHSEGDGAERAKNRSNPIDKATDSTMETPLTIACANGHKEIVELLLKEGANIEHRDKKGFSPLIIAATAGHASVVELLLKNHAAIEAQSDRTKDTALSLACSGGRKDVVELLLNNGANKEHRNVSDYTPLSLASSGGYIDIVNMLLTNGSEINSRTGSKLGISPLMLAAMNGHKEATKVLLERGSDINAQIETNRNTALTLASFQGRTEVVKLLLEHKPNVEHRAKTGLTPLMECASGGYVDVGNLLIRAGADTNAPPVQQTKDTALTISAEKGHEKFVQMLLENDAAIDTRNKKGCTALWLACNGGHLSTSKALLERGADPDTFDNRKMSPMMAAFRKGHVEIVKLLVNHAKQFPNEQDLTRVQQTSESEDIKKKCGECIMVIRAAKKAQAQSAEEAASNLLKLIEDEKVKDQEKKQKQKDKKKQKKEAKKNMLEPKKADDEFEAELEAELEPEPEQEREPDPEPEPEPEPEPAPIPEPEPAIEEPPKDPPKRRNRRKTNPDGVPKGPKVVKEEPPAIPEEEQLVPIVVTIPPPARVHAQMVSPGSYSETEDWCKAGKEGKKARPPKKEGSQKTPPTAIQPKERPTTSGNTTTSKPWEHDTKGKKVVTLTIAGRSCSRVIGKSGSNINAVRAATGATIEIDKHPGSEDTDRHITIRGSPEVVQNVVNIIQCSVANTHMLIQDAIRHYHNNSVASSASSDGTTKSVADSNPSSIPQSMSSASINRQSSSPAPAPSVQAFHHQKTSKAQAQRESKDQDGGNVWQQRMAARQERDPTPDLVSQQSPQPAPTPPPAQRVPSQPARPVSVTAQPTVSLPKPIQAPTPVSAPAPAPAAIDRVIARPAASTVVQPVKEIQQPLQQPRYQEPIAPRYQEPLPRPQPTVQPPQQQQPAFSKAPGSRPTSEFSRAPGPPSSSSQPNNNAARNELLDDRFAFGQYKPQSAIGPPASTSFSSSLNDDVNGKSDTFDISNLDYLGDAKDDNIWGEKDAWGGLFSGILNGSSISTPANSSKNDSTSEWMASDFMAKLLSNSPLPNLPTSQPPPSMTQQSTSAVSSNSNISALETKGWIPSSRDQNRTQPPLFARSQSSASGSNAGASSHQHQERLLQLQQQQQEQQRVALQQHQRLQQQMQQYHQQQQSSQNTPQQQQNMMMQTSQLYNHMHLGTDQHPNNMYSNLVHQLISHQESSSSAPGPSHQGPSSSQGPNNYYQSPSYTDSSVLAQLNMPSMAQRGLKQFDGFNNDSGSTDAILAALLDQQKRKEPSISTSGYMSQQPPQPFGAPSSSISSQSRLGMMPTRQPPPFVAQAPQAPPGFPTLGTNASQNMTGQAPQRLYQAYGQTYSQMNQMDWRQQQQGSQQNTQQQNPQQPPSSNQKWSPSW